MDMLIVEGGRPLKGSVHISGSKNEALPIIISTLLSDKKSTISNVPNLRDTKFLFELLESFGAEISYHNNVATIDASKINNNVAHYDVVRKMRASVLVLAPLLARCKKAVVSLPGGCTIGGRPVDIHLDGLKKLGAEIEVRDGYIYASLPQKSFIGDTYELPLPSVGASENLIMAAVLAKGQTVLKNVAKEPEVVSLCNTLNNAGARIQGIGTSDLFITGVTGLLPLNCKVSFDRIEAGTFMAIAAATKSELTLKAVGHSSLDAVVEKFKQAGLNFSFFEQDGEDCIDIFSSNDLRAVDIETAVYPGFPTDMQAQFMAAMTLADGVSRFFENIFENRFMHVPELIRMGADISVKQNMATVTGKKFLTAAPVMATDLRASASLIIAALAANGKSEIRRLYHLDRGYENIEQKLIGIGANVKRCQQD